MPTSTTVLSIGDTVKRIRTSRWAAKAPVGANLSDVDMDLDREVEFAIRVSDRVLNALLRKRPGVFAQRLESIFAAMIRTCRNDRWKKSNGSRQHYSGLVCRSCRVGMHWDADASVGANVGAVRVQ